MKILKLWKNIRGLAKVYLKKEKLVAASLLSRVIGLILILSFTPAGTMKVAATGVNIKPQAIDTAIQLDVQNPIPVKLPERKGPEITITESDYNRGQREAEERAQSGASNGSNGAFREVIARESGSAPADPSLAEKRALVKRAAAKYGIDWKILESVWQVETGKDWSASSVSSAGAQGPMQFMPGTWRSYADDGNGDGVSDIGNAEDAVYAAANLLAKSGADSGNIDAALFNYNHAQWYVNKVKGVANSIAE